MIAYKQTDYFIYFDDIDLSHLGEGWELVSDQLQNYKTREEMSVGLKNNDEMYSLCKKHKGMLVFSNETLLAVVHLSEESPTKHIFYFEKTWFFETIKTVKNDSKGYTIRWNGSGDKITILAGNGRESKNFQLMFGP